MISALLALASALPSILNLVGMIMSAFGASAAQVQTYQDMVNAQNEMGNLSVQSHDSLLGHVAAINARLAAAAVKAPAIPPAV